MTNRSSAECKTGEEVTILRACGGHTGIASDCAITNHDFVQERGISAGLQDASGRFPLYGLCFSLYLVGTELRPVS